MRSRFLYAGCLLLSLPSLFFAYIVIVNLPQQTTMGVIECIGIGLGCALALFSLYGITTGKPIRALPLSVKIFLLIDVIVAGFIAAGFVLFLMVALSWR